MTMGPDTYGLQAWLVRALLILVVAVAFAPMIRGLTVDMTETVGRAWPFALEHCRSGQTPGCRAAAPPAYVAGLATR